MSRNDASEGFVRLLLPETPSYAPRTKWGPILACLAALGIIIVAPLFAFSAARLYELISGIGQVRAFPPGALERILMTREAIFLFVLHTTMGCLTIFAASGFNSSPVKVLALAPPAGGWHTYATSLLIALSATAVWFSALLVWLPQLVRDDWLPFQQQVSEPWGWLVVPIRVLVAPVAEELLFRGFLFPALLKSRLGFIGAASLTSAAWTALHVNRADLAYFQLFATGVLLAWLLMRTGSLRVPIFCHVIYNAGVSFVVIVLGWPELPN